MRNKLWWWWESTNWNKEKKEKNGNRSQCDSELVSLELDGRAWDQGERERLEEEEWMMERRWKMKKWCWVEMKKQNNWTRWSANHLKINGPKPYSISGLGQFIRSIFSFLGKPVHCIFIFWQCNNEKSFSNGIKTRRMNKLIFFYSFQNSN